MYKTLQGRKAGRKKNVKVMTKKSRGRSEGLERRRWRGRRRKALIRKGRKSRRRPKMRDMMKTSRKRCEELQRRRITKKKKMVS